MFGRHRGQTAPGVGRTSGRTTGPVPGMPSVAANATVAATWSATASRRTAAQARDGGDARCRPRAATTSRGVPDVAPCSPGVTASGAVRSGVPTARVVALAVLPAPSRARRGPSPAGSVRGAVQPQPPTPPHLHELVMLGSREAQPGDGGGWRGVV